MVVSMPALTVTGWQGGATAPGAQPKHTVWLPTGTSVHIPQLFRGTPSSVIVAGSAGLVSTRSDPRCVKLPCTTVVAPAFTVTCCGDGSLKPSTCVPATV